MTLQSEIILGGTVVEVPTNRDGAESGGIRVYRAGLPTFVAVSFLRPGTVLFF